jgi:hypothetical protein
LIYHSIFDGHYFAEMGGSSERFFCGMTHAFERNG